MKVILYTHTFLPQIGGRELVVHYLARSLNRLGVNARVMGPSGWWRNRKLATGYPVRRYPSIVRAGTGGAGLGVRLREHEMQWQLRAEVLRGGADIVHAHTTYPTGYVAARARRPGDRWGLVITPHGVDVHVIPEKNHGMRLDPRVAAKIDQALKRANAVTAISGSIAASALDAGAPPGALHHISNGVDLERFAPAERDDPRPVLGLEADSELVVSVGNYHPRKGQEVLVRAMPALLAVRPRARLVIVGRGTEVLQPLVYRLQLEGKVVLPGALPFPVLGGGQDRLADLLCAGAAYVSAGTEEGAEGLSLALLEGMAAGCPVVASDISGNRDVVEEGGNGLLVRPGDAAALARRLAELLSDPPRRAAMADAARRTAEDYDWIGVARRYLALYENVLRTRERAGRVMAAGAALRARR